MTASILTRHGAPAPERSGVAEQIAAAKILAHQASLEVTSKVYGPVAYKYNELGRYFLNGTEPVPSAYR